MTDHARHETREARAVRKAVAEEIAEAVEGAFADRPISLHEALSLRPSDYLTQVVTIIREIGSRDPS